MTMFQCKYNDLLGILTVCLFVQGEEICETGFFHNRYCDVCYEESYYWKWFECHCCMLNSTWFCVSDPATRQCEAVAPSTTNMTRTTGSPFATSTPWAKGASSSINIRGWSIGVSLAVVIVFVGFLWFMESKIKRTCRNLNRRSNFVPTNVAFSTNTSGTGERNPAFYPTITDDHQQESIDTVCTTTTSGTQQQGYYAPPPSYADAVLRSSNHGNDVQYENTKI